jgi:hypothetical protein
MVLTSQQFAEIIHFLRNRVVPTRGAEKRRATRIELKSQIVVVPVDHGVSGERMTAMTRDISMEGMGLLSGVAMPSGQQLVAFLPIGDGETQFVLCEVTHCGMIVDGIFTLGCRFVQVLSKQAGHLLPRQSPSAPNHPIQQKVNPAEQVNSSPNSATTPVGLGSDFQVLTPDTQRKKTACMASMGGSFLTILLSRLPA